MIDPGDYDFDPDPGVDPDYLDELAEAVDCDGPDEHTFELDELDDAASVDPYDYDPEN